LEQLGEKTGFDFTSDRIFVEAFPRPDGGCMLYVSSLGDMEESDLPAEPVKKRKNTNASFKATTNKTVAVKRESLKTLLILEVGGIRELGGVCRSLHSQKEQGRIAFESAAYENDGRYRMVIKGENALTVRIAKEFGDVLKGERELMYTKEYFKPVIEENAVERLNELL
jgi:hypothetical protein